MQCREAAGMSIHIDLSGRPALSNWTLTLVSSVRRLAGRQPAQPPPMMMQSHAGEDVASFFM